LESEAENITRRLIEKAMEGDMAAIRLVIERLIPPAKDMPLNVDIPAISKASDIQPAMNQFFNLMASGDLSLSEFGRMVKALGEASKIAEMTEFEQRLTAHKSQ
jgi:hypothetical protein